MHMGINKAGGQMQSLSQDHLVGFHGNIISNQYNPFVNNTNLSPEVGLPSSINYFRIFDQDV
jgi:hypothetical protein